MMMHKIRRLAPANIEHNSYVSGGIVLDAFVSTICRITIRHEAASFLSSRVSWFPGGNHDKATKKTAKIMIDFEVNDFRC